MNGIVQIPEPANEPIRDYAPGSPERTSLKKRLDEMLGEEVDIPAVIGGKEARSGNTLDVLCPHDHGHKLGVCHQVTESDVADAAKAARAAWHEWSEMPWESRAAVFLKAAELLAGPWRDTINASTTRRKSTAPPRCATSGASTHISCKISTRGSHAPTRVSGTTQNTGPSRVSCSR